MLRKKNTYMRLTANGLFFIGVVFLMDLLVGNSLRWLYFKQKSGYLYELTYSLDSTEADVIILGSSHAKHHYVPSILEDTLRLNCYNFGSGGQNIFYHYGILGSVLVRHNPRIVILDLITIDFRKTEKLYNTERLSILMPYCASHKAINEVMDLRGPFEKVRSLSKIYPFNSQLLQMLYSFIGDKNTSVDLLKGYTPLEGKMTEYQRITSKANNYELDPLKIRYVTKIISLCKQNNIRLVIINSPSILNSEGESMSFDVIGEIGKEYDIEVWNYENDERFLKADYIHDAYHLNDEGAHVYTSAIASRLKRETMNDNLGIE
jgi:hypothetical protein